MDLAFNPHAILYFICTTWSAAITSLLFVKKPCSALTYSNLGMTLWFLGGGLAVAATSHNLTDIYLKIAYLGIISIFPFLLHFIYQFLNINTKNIRLQIKVNYLIGFLFILLTFFSEYFLKYKQDDWIYHTKASHLHPLFLIWFFIQGIIILVTLYKAQSDNKYPLEFRNKIKLILLTYTVAIWGSVDYIPLYRQDFYPFGYLISTMGLSITAYAVLKHQLLDIKIIIKKGLIYSILLAVISIIYLALVFSFEKIFQTTFGYQSFSISFSLAIFLGIIFTPLRNRIQYFVEKLLYRDTTEEASQKIKLLEQEVADKEKFKAVATLASGMSHEIKNPLTAI